MLTQMQNPTGPTNASIPATKPERGIGGELGRHSATESPLKTIAIHRPSESLRYLLKHLSANWTSKVESPSNARGDSADQQEL